ncbi:Mitochondrial distribution and morphology protein 10 [Microbotryomycetes sp. JL201]|nr:Mitochondrial distribution and morphology protein 10 [Microbotryomycetes sp. JL201]
MVYPQAAYLLREYFQATNWSLDNHYSVLTLPSRNLLDFPVPPGLHLALSHRPTPSFVSHLNLSTLVPTQPTTYPATPAPILSPASSQLLAAQLTYVCSSAPLGYSSTKHAASGADRVQLQDIVQSFRVEDLPVRPELRDESRETWQGGKRVDKSDFLMYGRLYIPNSRLDALYVHRISPTLQALVSLITVPSPVAPPTLTWATSDESPSASQTMAATAATSSSSSSINDRMSELEVKLQQDYGRWSAEYSYAFGDAMWGARGMYNFGKWGSGEILAAAANALGLTVQESALQRERVVDEEEEISTGGLKGRWSAGGEIFFSAQERSAGVSAGVRFCTLPESHGPPFQPPTTITATLNPIMGQLSAAYAVGVSSDTALGSRFDFNLYSYDADLTVGGEWFQRRKQVKARYDQGPSTQIALPPPPTPSFDAFARGALEERDRLSSPSAGDNDDEVVSVVKMRASTNTDMALLWEGRVGDFLVSLGLVADLRLASRRGGRTSPIKSVGLGVQYWA